ncbi:MAG: BREX system P-loop protein BrxC, partial [Acidobacteriota bacterium]
DTAAGRDLVEFFARAPFGWNPEVVQMLTGCLLRAGQIEATSGGRVIQDALTIEARATLTQDAAFRLASFRPRVGVEFTHLMAAVESFRTVFGREVPEMEPVTVAGSIRSALDQHEFDVQQALGVLLAYDLPGAPALQEALDDLRSLRSGSEEQVILGFNQNHRRLKEVIARAASLNSTLHGRHLQLLRRAKDFLIHVWPMLRREADLSERYRTQADTLQDLIDRDTFYRELPMIGDLVDGLEAEYRRRRDMAAWARADVYASALRALRAFSDWRRLEPAQQHRVAEPLQRRSRPEVAGMISIELLRADIDACPARLRQAIDALLALRGDEARDATLDIRRVVPPRIDDPAALDAALNSLHEACKALLDAGKRVHLR